MAKPQWNKITKLWTYLLGILQYTMVYEESMLLLLWDMSMVEVKDFITFGGFQSSWSMFTIDRTVHDVESTEASGLLTNIK